MDGLVFLVYCVWNGKILYLIWIFWIKLSMVYIVYNLMFDINVD